MGFRNRIKIRFLIILVVLVLFGGTFCSRKTMTAQQSKQADSNNQSGSCSLLQMWITGLISKSVLEQMGNNELKQESQNSYPILSLDRLLEYVFPAGGYKRIMLTDKLNTFMFLQRCGRGQTESCRDWTQWLLDNISNQLKLTILLLLIAHRCALEVILRHVIKAGTLKHITQPAKDLTNLKALLCTLMSLVCSDVKCPDEDTQEDEDLQLNNKKYSWMYEPLRWRERFTEYFSFSVLDRVSSFRPLSSLPLTNVPSVLLLAEAGFNYRGAGSTVECDGCRNVVDIKEFDSPAVEAKYHREGCTYIKAVNEDNSDAEFCDIEKINTYAAAARQPETITSIEPVICHENLTTIDNDNSSASFGNQSTSLITGNTLFNELPNDKSSSPNPPISNHPNSLKMPACQKSHSVAYNGDKHEPEAVPLEQLQKQAAATDQQQQRNNTPPLVQQQANEAAAQGQQQRKQAPPPVQQQTSSSPAQQQTSPPLVQQISPSPVQQQTSPSPVQQQPSPSPVQQQISPSPVQQQISPPLVQQQTSPSPVQQQTSSPLVQQQVNESAAMGQQQQQNQSLVNQSEIGACSAPEGSNDLDSTLVSHYNAMLFDLDEFDEEEEKYDFDNHENEKTCLKNPGHYSNFAMWQLKLEQIPSNVRHPDVLRLFELVGKLVVRVVVRGKSALRPKCNEQDTETKYRFGTGMATAGAEFKDSPAITESYRKWNTVKKYLPLLKNKGYVFIQINRHVVYDNFEAENTTVEFFYNNPNRRDVVTAKGVSIEHSHILGDSKSILKCKISDTSVIEVVKNTENEIMTLSTRLPQKIKEGLMKRVFVISHPHGDEKVLSYGEYVMVKYALKTGKRNEQHRPEMVKINNHTQISKNLGAIRKVLLYSADTCKGASGAVVISFVKKRNNNVEDIVLDLWMHTGVSKKHGLNASAMRELTPEDIANHGTPNAIRPSIQDEQEEEANSAANQVVSCPVYTVMGSPTHPAYAVYSKRLESYPNPFNHVHTAVDLADGGFFYAGYSDCVRCFHCGLGLRSWKPGDIIYEEHSRNKPGCQFLQMKLKAAGIDQLRFQPHEQSRRPQTSVQPQTLPSSGDDSHQTKLSMIVQQPITSVTQHASEEGSRIQANVLGQRTYLTSVAQQQMDTAIKASAEESRNETVVLLKRERRYLQQLLTCKICCQNPVKDLFLPCGELVSCLECSKLLTHCPSCNTKILATVTTFFV